MNKKIRKNGKCKTGRRWKDNVNTDRKDLGVEKFTSQKEGYPERGNELFLASRLGSSTRIYFNPAQKKSNFVRSVSRVENNDNKQSCSRIY